MSQPHSTHRLHRPTRTLGRGSIALALGLALGLTVAGAAVAGKAHQHGLSQLDVAVERQRVSLRWVTPLDDLLGFERAPRTEAERAAAQALLARLRDPAALVQLDGAAGCSLAGSRVLAPVLGAGAADAAPAAPAKAAGDHAELELELDFNCRDGARAGFVQLALFEAFPRLRRIEVQAVTPRGQLGAVLQRPNGRITLAR